MPIPAPYLVGLQMYEIDDEALALRAEVWRHLGPMMDTICDRHFAKILKFTPFYEESLKKTAEEWRRLVIHYTSRLFLNPFDEKFVEDALERVEIEIGLAADMRTRGTIAHSNQFQPRAAAAILAATPQSPSTHRRRAPRADVGCCQCHGSALFGASAGGEKTRQRAQWRNQRF